MESTPHTLNCLTGEKMLLRGIMQLCVERCQEDTLLPDNGVPIRLGECYFGIHVAALKERPTIGTFTTGLTVIAEVLRSVAPRWDREAAKADFPEYLVGVTHDGFARVASRAGFAYSPLADEACEAPQNAAVGWSEYCDNVRRFYAEEIAAGKRGALPRLAVVSMKVSEFVDTWELAAPNSYRRLVKDQMKIIRRDL